MQRRALLLCVLLGTSCSLLLDPELPDLPQTNADAGTPTTGAAFGTRCAGDLDCASNACRDRRCSQACSAANPCPSPTISECTAGQCRFVSPPPLDGPANIGFLYVGPVGDHGWTLTHHHGKEYMERQLPGIITHFEPSITAADAPRVIDQMIADGRNVIVGTSFDFLVPFQNKAANHPEVNFTLCSGFRSAPNLGSYFGRMYQVMWMVGRLAGEMTQTDKIGIIGPVVIPETVRHINAFTRGVQSSNPNARVYVRWVLAWFNPPEETAATQELIGVGTDVVFGHTDTTIPLEVSKTATVTGPQGTPVDVLSIGYDNRDSCNFAPDRCLTSAYWNWGPMITGVVQDMIDGDWLPQEAIWEQMKSDSESSSVYLAPMNERLVPTDVRIEIEGYIPQLARPGPEGQQLPFEAPVLDNTQMVRLPAGERFTDEALLSMCWFVDGVYDVNGQPGVVPPACVGDR